MSDEQAMLTAEERPQWRVGRRMPINVYEGESPVGQCQTPEYAQVIVDAVNSCTAHRATIEALQRKLGLAEERSRLFAVTADQHAEEAEALERDRAELIEALRPLAADWTKRPEDIRSLSDSVLKRLWSVRNVHTVLDEKRAFELLARLEKP